MYVHFTSNEINLTKDHTLVRNGHTKSIVAEDQRAKIGQVQVRLAQQGFCTNIYTLQATACYQYRAKQIRSLYGSSFLNIYFTVYCTQ